MDLDRTCDIFLNVEADNEGKDNEDIEREVTDFILNNSYQNDDGQYVMVIPWLTRYKGCLNSNEKLAFKVLQNVKHKHHGGGNILECTDKVFKDHLESGITERVWDFDKYKKEHARYSFISHFPLVKDERQTSKVREVYMANLCKEEIRWK